MRFYSLPFTSAVKTPGEDTLLQERSHLTSRSASQQGTLGLTGIRSGVEEEKEEEGEWQWEGKNGDGRCQRFKPDATAVCTDDASAVSAPTQLHDQLRTQ